MKLLLVWLAMEVARVPEAQHDIRDQRALRGHVETEREAANHDLVELHRESRNHEAEDHPQSHDDPHQAGRFFPVRIALRGRQFSHLYLPLSVSYSDQTPVPAPPDACHSSR